MTNKYCEESVTLVKDIFGRQNQHCIEVNSLFYDNTQIGILERESLGQVNIQKAIDLLKEANLLCLPDCDPYKRAKQHAIT